MAARARYYFHARPVPQRVDNVGAQQQYMARTPARLTMPMVHLHSEIECDAPVADAFRLLCDPERVTRLNPRVNLLSAEVLSAGSLALGSRLQYRLRLRSRIANLFTEVTAFVPDRLIEYISDTHPPFRVRQTLEPTLDGCRLTHEEWLSPADAQVQSAVAERPLVYLLRMLQSAVGLSRPSDTELEQTQRDTLRDEMQSTLGLWLHNIKHHLETAASSLRHDPSAAT
jgi:hypothetical protein